MDSIACDLGEINSKHLGQSDNNMGFLWLSVNVVLLNITPQDMALLRKDTDESMDLGGVPYFPATRGGLYQR